MSPPAANGRYLRRFVIEGVRAFKTRQEIDFCDAEGRPHQWTVILGENGTGKTTLLQYIAGLMPVEMMSPHAEPDERGITGFSNYYGPVMLGSEWRQFHVKNVSRPWPSSGLTSLNATLWLSKAASSIRCPEAEMSDDHLLSIAVHVADMPRVGRQSVRIEPRAPGPQDASALFALFAYGAGRHVAGPASPYLTGGSGMESIEFSPVQTLFNDDHPLLSPEQWLFGLDHSRLKDDESSAARILTSAYRCLRGALPGITDIRIEEQGFSPKLVFTTPFSSDGIEFSGLSLGYRSMAAWLIDFLSSMLQRYPDLEEPEKAPAVVLIDEFDLHMHPTWQAEAMASLSKEFPNTQFIITAHSPLVVQATEGKAKIVVLRRETREDGTSDVIIDDDPTYAAGWRVDQILTSSLYGLESSRSPEFTRLMDEMVKLRQRDDLTAPARTRLKELDALLEAQAPPGMSSASASLFADLIHTLQDK